MLAGTAIAGVGLAVKEVADRQPISMSVTPAHSLEFTGALNNLLSSGEVEEIANAITDYVNEYSCIHPTITIDETFLGIEDAGGGYVDVAFEEAEPKKLSFDPKTFRAFGKQTGTTWREISLHAMTHVCRPTERRAISTPATLAEGVTIIGFEGFGIVGRTSDGQVQEWTVLDEAAAELFAQALEPTYAGAHPSYVYVGRLLRELTNSYSSMDDMHELVVTQDVEGFVRKIRGLEQIAGEDIALTMYWFNAVYQAAETNTDPEGTFNKVLAEIKATRGHAFQNLLPTTP